VVPHHHHPRRPLQEGGEVPGTHPAPPAPRLRLRYPLHSLRNISAFTSVRNLRQCCQGAEPNSIF
jgi:hypothetical protein